MPSKDTQCCERSWMPFARRLIARLVPHQQRRQVVDKLTDDEKSHMKSRNILNLTVLILVIAPPVMAQQTDPPRTLSASDYARAEKWMPYNTNPLVFRSGVRPTWQADDRFWYRITTAEGSEFLLVDAAKGTRAPAFDHAKLAAALSAATGTTYDAHHLPFTDFELSANRQTISFSIQRRRWNCDLVADKCSAERTPPASGQRGGRGGPANDILSPDKKRAAFIRDFNLWVRDLATGKETQLTTDGVKDFGYATDNAGWIHSDRPVLLWSPDSEKIATFRHDGRGVGEMYLVHTAVGHPTLEAWKYPLAGDDKIFQIERVIIDVDAAKVVRLQMPPDPHRSSLCDHIQCSGSFADVEWSADSQQLAFISSSRDHKRATFRVADTVKASVRDVIEEKATTYFEGGKNRPNWRF